MLCIVPINTIQNWISEFNRWVPPAPPAGETGAEGGGSGDGAVRHRNFGVHVLNDVLKNLDMRSKVTSRTAIGIFLI